MADEYIRREDALSYARHAHAKGLSIIEYLEEVPAADIVAANAFKQVVWERDIALGQLAEIGKGLGAKMDEVRPVVHAKWIVHFECPVCGEGSSSPLDKCPFCKSELSSDMVSDEALKQVMWERDIALGQLAEVGKGLGAKMDDVRPVVHGRWVECGDNQPISCDKVYCCSHCRENRRFEWQLKPFCQECGAEMQNYETAIS